MIINEIGSYNNVWTEPPGNGNINIGIERNP